jgi:hypothetical protein
LSKRLSVNDLTMSDLASLMFLVCDSLGFETQNEIKTLSVQLFRSTRYVLYSTNVDTGFILTFLVPFVGVIVLNFV